MEILKATSEHIAEVAGLFDLYRQFYQCDPDPELALRFISERVQRGESDIFVAFEQRRAKGFVQLYPSFCSVEAVKIFILYDLYVDADARNRGIGALLMQRAAAHARENGASRIDLLTAITNSPGRHLYEKLGYERANEGFYGYELQL